MQALTVAAWTNPSNYFRHALRLFNGEDLQLAGGPTQLSTTQGISVSTENMVYIWGNYNTTGINLAPPPGNCIAKRTYCHLQLSWGPDSSLRSSP